MMMVGHTAIGATIGLLVPAPVAAFLIGVVSHHVADWVPHFDIGSFMTKEVREKVAFPPLGLRDWFVIGLDILLTIVLLTYLAGQLPLERTTSIAAGIFGANLPDIVHNVPFWSNGLANKVGWIRWWRDAIHRTYQSPVELSNWVLGISTQVFVIIVALWMFA